MCRLKRGKFLGLCPTLHVTRSSHNDGHPSTRFQKSWPYDKVAKKRKKQEKTIDKREARQRCATLASGLLTADRTSVRCVNSDESYGAPKWALPEPKFHLLLDCCDSRINFRFKIRNSFTFKQIFYFLPLVLHSQRLKNYLECLEYLGVI